MLSNRGELWKSADLKVRKCYLVVLAFQVDYPEACLLTLIHQNQACPACTAHKSNFSSLQKTFPKRTVQEMSEAFNSAWDLEKLGDTIGAEEILQKHGLANIEV